MALRPAARKAALLPAGRQPQGRHRHLSGRAGPQLHRTGAAPAGVRAARGPARRGTAPQRRGHLPRDHADGSRPVAAALDGHAGVPPADPRHRPGTHHGAARPVRELGHGRRSPGPAARLRAARGRRRRAGGLAPGPRAAGAAGRRPCGASAQRRRLAARRLCHREVRADSPGSAAGFHLRGAAPQRRPGGDRRDPAAGRANCSIPSANSLSSRCAAAAWASGRSSAWRTGCGSRCTTPASWPSCAPWPASSAWTWTVPPGSSRRSWSG